MIPFIQNIPGTPPTAPPFVSPALLQLPMSQPQGQPAPRAPRRPTPSHTAPAPAAILRTVLDRMPPDIAAASETEFQTFAAWVGFPDASTAALFVCGLPTATLAALLATWEQHLHGRMVLALDRAARLERLDTLFRRVRASCPRSRAPILDIEELRRLWLRVGTMPVPPAVRACTQAILGLLISPQLHLDQVAALTPVDCSTQGFVMIRAVGSAYPVTTKVSVATSAAIAAWRRHLAPETDDDPLFLGRQRGPRPPLRRQQDIAQMLRGLRSLIDRPVDANGIIAAARIECRLRSLEPWQLVMPQVMP
jgi:hypothetical protein